MVGLFAVFDIGFPGDLELKNAYQAAHEGAHLGPTRVAH